MNMRHFPLSSTLIPYTTLFRSELEFMNSSSLKVFVSWIADLHDEVDQTYKLRFLSNTRHHWQRRSLVSLRTFAVDRVIDRKSTRLNSSHANISYAVLCLKKKNI